MTFGQRCVAVLWSELLFLARKQTTPAWGSPSTRETFPKQSFESGFLEFPLSRLFSLFFPIPPEFPGSASTAKFLERCSLCRMMTMTCTSHVVPSCWRGGCILVGLYTVHPRHAACMHMYCIVCIVGIEASCKIMHRLRLALTDETPWGTPAGKTNQDTGRTSVGTRKKKRNNTAAPDSATSRSGGSRHLDLHGHHVKRKFIPNKTLPALDDTQSSRSSRRDVTRHAKSAFNKRRLVYCTKGTLVRTRA